MRRLALVACLVVAGCGDDTSKGATPDGGADARVSVPDAGGTADTSPTADADRSPDMPPPVGDECESDLDCTDGVFCNGVERCFRGLCFSSPTPQCGDLSSCTVDECDETNKRCDYVPDDGLCAPGQICRSKGGCFTPATCAVDEDCADGLICNGAERCIGGSCEPGDPVECGDGVACTADTCVEGTGECQSVADHTRCLAAELCILGTGCSPRPPCTGDDDCDDGLFCNGRESCGTDGLCIPGEPPLQPDAVDCTIDQCNEALDLVVSTPDNARCSDGVFCNGAEVCHPTDGCGPGVPPALSDGVGCTVDTCNEALRLIEHAPDHALCDDGAFCNGEEQCHPITGCSPGEPPELNDGIGCTVDTCSEVMDVVLHVTDDSLCDDGLFCNGTEICSRTDDCVTGVIPVLDDGVACTADTCDETLDTIVHLPNDSLCGSGDLCTSAEICDVTQGCVTGPPVIVDDNIACTIDACDALTGVSHTPDNTLCDDGLFCNGAETCGASGCTPGTSPTNDGDPCTIDSCNESTDTVSHIPAANGTICGGAPRSICLGGGCVASVCGDGFIDGGLGELCDDGNTNSGDGCNANCQPEVIACDPDGTWTLSAPVSHTCLLGLVTVSTGGSIGLQGDGSVATGIYRDAFFSGSSQLFMSGSGAQCPSGSFTVTAVIDDPGAPETCIETYTLTGTFNSANSWSGQFTADFTNVTSSSSNKCYDCVLTNYPVSGTR